MTILPEHAPSAKRQWKGRTIARSCQALLAPAGANGTTLSTGEIAPLNPQPEIERTDFELLLPLLPHGGEGRGEEAVWAPLSGSLPARASQGERFAISLGGSCLSAVVSPALRGCSGADWSGRIQSSPHPSPQAKSDMGCHPLRRWRNRRDAPCGHRSLQIPGAASAAASRRALSIFRSMRWHRAPEHRPDPFYLNGDRK